MNSIVVMTDKEMFVEMLNTWGMKFTDIKGRVVTNESQYARHDVMRVSGERAGHVEYFFFDKFGKFSSHRIFPA